MAADGPRGASGVPEVAIVGMAGRFPGARSIDQLWRNLIEGIDSIHHFSDAELVDAGVPPEALSSLHYVRAAGLLDDPDRFDAAFFGIAPREAAAMDPQHRVFLECAWEALEHSGYGGPAHRGSVGVFAGASANTYLWNVYSDPLGTDLGPCGHGTLGNDRDFLATRVSYKLDLTGPSLDVQTACSTSLVAVHLACQSLVQEECALALAGGVSIRNLEREGYWFTEGGILSPDGRCRPFDAAARGTVGGDGVAVVVLKLLQDAIDDGDTIYAVIKATAVNNDGAAKMGYTAPGFHGQTAVVAEAIAAAGVTAASIGYVECHGTGTPLGDPLEIAALTEAFRADTRRVGYCAIGSVKANIGHLDAASGIAGLVKAALCLHHQLIPPAIHFERPNPEIVFEQTPFVVNRMLTEWKGENPPRRAGVSSFGIGGTNAHVVLEAAPVVAARPRDTSSQVLVLSARTPAALEAATDRLAAYLDAHPAVRLADVAFTLQAGRQAFERRRAVICRDISDAVSALRARRPVDASPADEPAGEARLCRLAADWLDGASLDWSALRGETAVRRCALPTYPFERERHWIAAATRLEPASWRTAAVATEPQSCTTEQRRPDGPHPYVAPRTLLEERLAAVWAAHLGYDRLGIHDDYFDLGGDSRSAADLAARLSRALDLDVPVHALLDMPTIATLADALSARDAPDGETATAGLVTLKRGTGPGAIVCIHPAGGGLFCYRHLAGLLAVPDAIYGIDAAPAASPGARVEELAAAYLEVLGGSSAVAPKTLLGFSMGGVIAYEMARQLMARARAVPVVALIDSMSPPQIPSWCDATPDAFQESVRAGGAPGRFASHVKALRRYTPQPYDGALVFYRARQRPAALPAHPELAWIELAVSGVEVHVIPGTHQTILDAPGARLIARSLERAMAAVGAAALK